MKMISHIILGSLRATRYFCMLLGYVLEQKSHQEKMVMKLKLLESSMSKGHKMFKLGNTMHLMVETWQAAQLPNAVARISLTASNLSHAMRFTCDTVLWVKSIGLLSDVNKEKWAKWAARSYYYCLLINLVKDFYALCWRMEMIACFQNSKQPLSLYHQKLNSWVVLVNGGLPPFLLLTYLTLKKHPPLLLDTVKNLCDLSIPLDQQGIYKTNPGVIGLCGLISSLVGILTVARPGLQLKH